MEQKDIIKGTPENEMKPNSDEPNLNLNARLSQSPRLKLKNKSKFDAIRSIFEPIVPVDYAKVEGEIIPDSESLMSFRNRPKIVGICRQKSGRKTDMIRPK